MIYSLITDLNYYSITIYKPYMYKVIDLSLLYSSMCIYVQPNYQSISPAKYLELASLGTLHNCAIQSAVKRNIELSHTINSNSSLITFYKNAPQVWLQIMQGRAHCVLHIWLGCHYSTVDIDNITIAWNSHRAMQRFINKLSSHYGIKDMDTLHWLLGIGIDRNCKNWTISFSQAAYL